jgi:DNA mismatch repair protein MutS
MDTQTIPDVATLTPVMAQYWDAKRRYPDALLFFRMGDFYELFFKDAEIAAEVLGIALTKRGKDRGEDIPMAGVPQHAMEGYLGRLVKLGHRVAICEQLEDPAEAKKRGYKAVVKRDVVRVVTPGTLTEDQLLDARVANRLVAVACIDGAFAVASAELSTAIVDVQCVGAQDLAATLAALAPSEIILGDHILANALVSEALDAVSAPVQPRPKLMADPKTGQARLCALYGVATLDGFGALTPVEVSALGLIADYLMLTQPGAVVSLLPPRQLGASSGLAIDPATRASLEIDRTRLGERAGSLLSAIDRTVTGAGGRLLAERLNRPLTDVTAIEARLDAVAWCVGASDVRAHLRDALKQAGDMARALTRLGFHRGSPRDLGTLRDTLATCEGMVQYLLAADLPAELAGAKAAISFVQHPQLQALALRLDELLDDELPAQVRDGGFIRRGVDLALEECRTLRDDSRRYIMAIEGNLAQETGLSTLKIRHNGVLGYYIEVSAKQADALFADEWKARLIHRQTLANQVRFTTPELADLDAKVAQAGDRALARETALFEDMVAQVLSVADEIRDAAHALSVLDVSTALAEWAVSAGACRPVVDDTTAFSITAGRHPVVEVALRTSATAFTPNDCTLDGAGQVAPRLALITGPNMAGKSTFLRQNALMVVLAQAGSFVPATRARIGLVDRLFSRVGAADDLARGRSTFMAEMVETAAILAQATPRSFVILDEIGRGTATFDGLAIAWAVAEGLHETNKARALFATHYHELAQLEERLGACANWCLKAKEWNGDLIFLHEVGQGAADRSYGLAVAKLAGVPRPVLARAEAVLKRLEKREGAELSTLPLFSNIPLPEPDAAPHPVLAVLNKIDPDTLSPKAAMEALYHLKGLV